MNLDRESNFVTEERAGVTLGGGTENRGTTT